MSEQEKGPQPPQYNPGQQPPPYMGNPYPPGAPQGVYTQSSANTVVLAQPAPYVMQTQVIQDRSRPELGIAAIVFAVMTTVFVTIFGCWWSLPCTIVAIVLGVTSSNHGNEGDMKTSTTHFGVSIGCTVFGIIWAIGGLAIIIGTVVGFFTSPAYLGRA